MNGYDAVTVIAKNIQDNTGIEVFKYDKPSNHIGEYIVVNQLSFGKSSINFDIINVNIHIPDINHDSPNLIRIESVTKQLLPLFEHKNYKGAYFDLEQDNILKDVDGTHYKNLRIRTTHVNL